MPVVEITRRAAEQLDRLIVINQLPADTRPRRARSLSVLGQFPLAGRRLEGDWSEFRFWIGPWPWLLCVYEFIAERELVAVVAIHDALIDRSNPLLTAPDRCTDFPSKICSAEC